jgi:hypothetical protein
MLTKNSYFSILFFRNKYIWQRDIQHEPMKDKMICAQPLAIKEIRFSNPVQTNTVSARA